MKSPIGPLEKLKTYLFKQYSGDAGKMLLHTATLGWIFSAAGQIFGIATNDKVSKEQKKFLIPQEIADAAINILSFYTVTACIQNFTKKLASSGRIITPEIKKFCHIEKITLGKNSDIGKSILSKIKELETTSKTNNRLSELNDFYDHKYAPFESGLKVIGNVIGAVLSSNIITPLLRNPIAAYKQKQDIAREKMKNENEQIMPAPRIILGKNESNTNSYNPTLISTPHVILGSNSMKV